MRLLTLEHKLFFSLKSIFLDFSIAQEGHRELSPVEVQTMLNQVNATLVPLQVVQAKQKINLVIFKHRE